MIPSSHTPFLFLLFSGDFRLHHPRIALLIRQTQSQPKRLCLLFAEREDRRGILWVSKTVENRQKSSIMYLAS